MLCGPDTIKFSFTSVNQVSVDCCCHYLYCYHFLVSSLSIMKEIRGKTFNRRIKILR